MLLEKKIEALTCNMVDISEKSGGKKGVGSTALGEELTKEVKNLGSMFVLQHKIENIESEIESILVGFVEVAKVRE